ncbi:MAG: tetratricopeptide repeat protein [Nitrospira sp.]|nr:tetratricopeptide repeat protein [bacterium]MBL7031631.1 tetratricopeptide repeat protein [Nitrospira sp.]
MKFIAAILLISYLLLPSISLGENNSLQKAYDMYYRGDKQKAIELVEGSLGPNSDPAAYYFLGYAYYEMQRMEKAAKYFNEAYIRRPFYSPIPSGSK